MTYSEFIELQNIDLEELGYITGIKDLIEDDLSVFKICLERYIKPNYKDYDFYDAIVKYLEESKDYLNREVSGIYSSLRDSTIDKIIGDADSIKNK